MAQLPILTRYLPLACGALLLSSCSYLDKTLSSPTADYKKSQTAPTLEVPPDLNVSQADDALAVPSAAAEDNATYSAYSQTTPERAGGRSAERAPGAERNPCRA